jgi:hypothetical protein
MRMDSMADPCASGLLEQRLPVSLAAFDQEHFNNLLDHPIRDQRRSLGPEPYRSIVCDVLSVAAKPRAACEPLKGCDELIENSFRNRQAELLFDVVEYVEQAVACLGRQSVLSHSACLPRLRTLAQHGAHLFGNLGALE